MSVEGYNKVKIVAQDDPVTVDQIRTFRENNIFRYKDWTNEVFSAVWDRDDTGDTGGTYYSPMVNFKGGAEKLLIVVCYDGTGANLELNFNYRDESHAIFFAGESGVHVATYELSVEGTELYSTTDFQGRFSISGGTLGLDMYYFGVFSLFADAPTDNQTSPELREQATDTQLRQIVKGIDDYHDSPKFLGGWMGSESLPQETLPYTGEQFYLFSMFDDNESGCSDEKNYTVRAAIDGNGAASGTNEGYLSNADSTDTSVIEHTPSGTAGEVETTQVSNVSERSYNTSAPYSLIKWNWAKTGDTSNTSKLLGQAVYAGFPVLNDARRQSTSGTGVDVDYWGIDDGADIDFDLINVLGRSQFNQFANSGGNVTAYIKKDGYSVSIPTTDTSIFYAPIYQRNHWALNQYASDDIHFDLAMYIENETGSSVDIEVHVDNAGDGSTPVSITLATGYNIVKGSFNLAMDNEANPVELYQIYMKTTEATAKTLKVWSWQLIPAWGSLTY